MPTPRIRILFIGGIGRSGSSLLERLLDQSDDFAAFGEIDKLSWSKERFDKRQLCGCGEPFQACPFWRDVMARAVGGMESFDPRRFADQRDVAAGRNAKWALLRGRGDAAHEAAFGRLADSLQALYGALHEACGGRVIVDSSKDALYAMALSRLPNVELSFLHLLRDPRAVAYSWQRQKKRPEIAWEERMMDVFAPDEVARRWVRANAMALAARWRATRSMGLTYESFVRDPSATLAAIADFVGVSRSAIDGLIRDGEASLVPGHTVMGNPDRMARSVRIRLDDAWRRELGAAERRRVQRQVWPLWPLFWWYDSRRPAATPNA
ncbi:MAG: sulfotransferase [Pseudomonadota bacterium]